MSKFVEMTYEVYKRKVGDKFGLSVPCIFTDEPQFATKTQLSHALAKDDVFLPWTMDLPETFRKEFLDDLEDLPQLVWNLPNGASSLARYLYHDHVCERFVSAFKDQLSSWCRSNNLMLDGHMMKEPTLHSPDCSHLGKPCDVIEAWICQGWTCLWIGLSTTLRSKCHVLLERMDTEVL